MRLIDALLSTIYPRTCPVCGRVMVEGETTMCLACRINLPETGFHHKADFNSIHERTMCHIPVHRAAAFFYYEKKSPYTRLIHRAKYGGLPSEARALAREYAAQIAPSGFFDGVDLIQPVPLSTGKLMRRGYNQSYHIALGVADVTGTPIGSLLKARPHSTQTRKDAAARMANATGTYSVDSRKVQGVNPAHILIVDDIVTTGATITACADALRKSLPMADISVLTLAASRLS